MTRAGTMAGTMAVAFALLACNRDRAIDSGSAATSTIPSVRVVSAPADSARATAAATAPIVPAPPTPSRTRDRSRGDAEHATLDLLKLTLTSAIKGKDPEGVLAQAKAGERVYAHLRLQNRSESERTIRLLFTVDGQLRTSVELDVEPSWSFRTWGYVTLRASDAGRLLEVAVVDDEDREISRSKLPIKASR